MYKKIMMWTPSTDIGKTTRNILVDTYSFFLYPEFRKFKLKPLLNKIKIFFSFTGIVLFTIFLISVNETNIKLFVAYSTISKIRNNAIGMFYVQVLDSVKSSDEYIRYHIYSKTEVKVPKTITRDHLVLLINESIKNDIPLDIAIRLIKQESRFDSTLVSRVGAFGYMQMMPNTFKEYYTKLKLKGGRTMTNNIKVGMTMLGELNSKWSNRIGRKKWEMVLASYNAGPNLVDSLQRVPEYKETKDYIISILD
jgi:soluble lytic murein transglycosylase-like protein